MVPGWSTRWPRLMARCLYNVSTTSELLPEPDTPVTQVSTPSGKRQSMPRRLLVVTLCRVSQPWGSRRSSGRLMLASPRR